MCKFVDDYFETCTIFELKCELEYMATDHMAIDNYGEKHVPLWKVKAILKKLECKNADV
jgi:hypothetical protein